MRHDVTTGFVFARTFVAALLVTALVSQAHAELFADDDKPATTENFSDEIARTVSAFKACERRFYADLRRAGQDKEKVAQLNDDYNRDSGAIVAAFIASLEAHRADPAFLDGMVALVVDLSYPPPTELLEIVKRQYIASPKLARICPELGGRGDEQWSRELLEAIRDQSPHREARGRATYALGEYYRHASLPFARQRPDAEIESSLVKAREFYNLALQEFADVPADNGRTIGQQATLQIARLDNLPNLKVGKPAPEIVGTDLDGRQMALSETRGKVTVIVFWGTWCGPCMRMVPHERELLARHKDKPFVILGVNSGDDLKTAQATVEKHQMRWRHWWDGGATRESPIQIAYNIQHWPTVFVLDKAGIIRSFDPRGEELDKVVDSLLAQEATDQPE
ncbi:MAG: TlpA family protein disulfide reductase [Pirellulales bacterium]|nr:TlpA family protein disulfide reductase [Pirellulales bacterium]